MKRILTVIALLATCLNLLLAQQNSQLRKLQLALYAITNLYVDSVDDKHLAEVAIQRMLSDLDPHSTYTNPQETKELNEPLKGGFEGIGVQFQMVDDTLVIIQPVSGGPSEKVGIIAGDRIIAVNDTAIAGVKMKTEEIMSRLRGPKGTKVNLSILRQNIKDPLRFTVTRDKIPLFSIDAAYMARPTTGYIKINRFSATTPEETAEALKNLRKQGMKDLILDLQGNGGGFLDAAINIANEFLDLKDLIVYTEGRNSTRAEFRAKGDGTQRSGRIVVLIDEYSASASEIVSGAIQDHDRGIIVGRRSFGKGLVQQAIPLPDGSMIRLTTSRYYTPAGRCIQKPYTHTANDTLDKEAYNKDLLNRYKRGELMHADSIHYEDSLKVKTLRLGRNVYGGGGITPDIFIPLDTTKYTKYHTQLSAHGAIIKASISFVDANREQLKSKYKTFKKFNEDFKVPDELLARLRTIGEESGVKYDEQQYNESRPILCSQLKGLIARDIWDMSEYFQVINPIINESYLTALQLLSDGTYEKIIPTNNPKK
ncbi:MAG: S41 family peptidase [Bacteroidales bacterium]|nr:S41 family peptidase [Bacteroidales bacterium]